MTQEALRMALVALEVEQTHVEIFRLVPKPHLTKAITAIKEALAQPEQEPVGQVVNATDKAFECKFVKILPIGTKLYASPPQRKPLTDEEIDQGLLRSNHALQTAVAWRDGVEWAIKQLKEKNT